MVEEPEICGELLFIPRPKREYPCEMTFICEEPKGHMGVHKAQGEHGEPNAKGQKKPWVMRWWS